MSHPHAAHATHADATEEALVRDTTTIDGKVRHQNEQDERAPVMAPEAGLVSEARPEPKAPEAALVATPEAPLVPPPAPKIPKEPQSVAEGETPAPVAQDSQPDVRVRAEEALAAYIHDGLKDKPGLLEGLKLDVLPVVGYGATGIKLCFHGPHVTTKAPELNEALIGHNNGLLTQHPVLAKFFHNAAELPKIDVPSDGSDMYHVVIPMTVETYKTTLKELGGEALQTATLPPAQGPLVSPESVQASSAVVNAAAVPQSVVQAPVAALEKAVNDNAIDHIQGAAR